MAAVEEGHCDGRLTWRVADRRALTDANQRSKIVPSDQPIRSVLVLIPTRRIAFFPGRLWKQNSAMMRYLAS